MVAKELAGRPGKQENGSAKTREVELGVLFTQTKTDEDGLPVRDHQSTTDVGGFDAAPDFGARIRAEARQRLGEMNKPSEETLTKQIAYFEHHQDKMRYQTDREQGLFYGSGVIEGGSKSVIGQRLKESGMLRTEQGASRVWTMRAALQRHRWDECWDRLQDSHYLTIRAVA